MTSPPSTPPATPNALFSVPGAPTPAARITELEKELEATTARAQRAVATYEIAYLTEHSLSNASKAVPLYLQSFNFDHSFRLPLYALLRMFERRGSKKNLVKLYDAQAKSPRDDAERAAALLDIATLGLLSEGDAAAARARVLKAVEQAPEAIDAVLLSEFLGRSADDDAAVSSALSAMAEHGDDPTVRALALCESAVLQQAALEIDEARASLAAAVRAAPELETAHFAATAFLRSHGPLEQLVDSLARHARLLGKRLKEDELPDADREKLSTEASALWCEAARVSCGPLAAPGDALACLKEAAELTPNDVWVRQLRMLAYDMLEDRKNAAAEAGELLEKGAKGPHAAGLHFRRAELALTDGGAEEARTELVAAIEQSGGSAAAEAILDDLLLDAGLHQERVEQLERRAAGTDADGSTAQLKAALIAAHELGDMGKAGPLFQAAAENQPLRETALREAYWAGVAHGEDDTCRSALDGLLDLDLDADERAALIHHRLALSGGDDSGASQRISAHLTDPSCSGWLPQVARVRAAAVGNWPMLAQAHHVLSQHSDNPEEAAAHLCAAARAQLRSGDAEAAEESLKAALEKSPAQPYALALLEEALRAQGHEHEVVELLLGTAEQQKSSHDAELSLLLAGAAAEAAGEMDRAAQTYEEAADRNPESVGPLWALLRLSRRMNNAALEVRAREGLSQFEQSHGQAGHESLLLAEHYAVVSDQPELAAATLEPVLETPDVAMHAALDLLLLRGVDGPLRQRATEVLTENDPDLRVWWQRELGGAHLRSEDAAVERGATVDAVLAERGDDRWALWTGLHMHAQEPGQPAASALERLASAVTDTNLCDVLRSEALRARRWGTQHGELAGDLEAAGLGAGSALPAAAARAVLEEHGPADDPAMRVRALLARLDQTTGADRSGILRGLARAQMQGGDHASATELLIAEVEQAPEDLAAWELLRVSARHAARWDQVPLACDRLRAALDGELWAQLSEEAAAVRMDHLGEDEQALSLLSEVLTRFPHRPIAYGRMHDLLSEKDDTAGLRTLVAGRINSIDDASELTKLFYEQARLCRADGDLDDALSALDNLLMLESDHVAGLALTAEIHTSRGNWGGAVEALRELAVTDIPGAQRKLARLGAADYLEKKLEDSEGALDELLALETEGLADGPVFVRMAGLYERAQKWPQCVKSLRKAADESTGEDRARRLLEAARVLDERGEPADARAAYEQVQALVPGHEEVAESLARLITDTGERNDALKIFEDASRQESFYAATNPEPYRKLRTAAKLREDSDLEMRSVVALVALGEANGVERAWLEQRSQSQGPLDSTVHLSDDELRAILTPALDGAYDQLARPVFRGVDEHDSLEPSRFGVGRSDRVSPRESSPLRDEVRSMLTAVGGELADFYIGGALPALIAATPKGLATHFILGVGVTAPLGASRRHLVAEQIAAAKLGSYPLLSRPIDECARLLHSAFLAGDRPLSPTLDAGALGELPKQIWKAMARRDRKAATEALSRLDDGGTGARQHCLRLTRQMRRLALLLSGDLLAALSALLEARPDASLIATSEDATDLMRTWVSSELGPLRRNLGIAQ